MAYWDNIMNAAYNYGTWGGGGKDKASAAGGLFGLGDFTSMGLLGLGGDLFKALGSLLGGESEGEKRAKKTFKMAQNRLGQSPLDPNQYLADFMRSMVPEWNQQGENIAKRTGLDSGVAQGAIIDAIQPDLARFMFQANIQNDMARYQGDQALLSLMASLSGR